MKPPFLHSHWGIRPMAVEDPTVYRLRTDVTLVNRGDHFVLAAPGCRTALRLGCDYGRIHASLYFGATFDELIQLLCDGNPPDDAGEAILRALLARLSSSRFLDCGEGSQASDCEAERRFIPLPAALKLSQWLGSFLASVPRSLRQAVCLAFVFFDFLGVAYLTGLNSARVVFGSLEGGQAAMAAAVFLLVVIPLHELSHGIVATGRNIRVRAIGLTLSRGFFPIPFVDTTDAYREASSGPRIAIAMAGPWSDISCAGLAAWAGVVWDDVEYLRNVAFVLTMLCLGLAAANLNPFRRSDGSRALEAVLNDDFARQNALGKRRSPLSSELSRRRYWLACMAYLLVLPLLAWRIW